MSDPLHEGNMTNPHINSLKFAKLHSPKMKSVYWRHFGYPTNEDDCIITKQNVVCILCHKVLTNHGNTTNLRAHLQYRHKEIFNKIVAENGIKVPPRKVIKKSTHGIVIVKRELPGERKVKTEYFETSQNTSLSGEGCEDQSVLYESIVPETYEDDEAIDSNQFTKIGVTTGLEKNATSFQFHTIKKFENNDNEVAIAVEDGSEMLDSYQFQFHIVNLVIDDMRNIDTLYEPGFSKFTQIIAPTLTIPPPEKITSYIKEMYSDKRTSIADQLKMHSQIKPFSLGFEVWTNVEDIQFLSVYYNYTNDSPEYNLINQLYCTMEYNKYSLLEEAFEDFNLQNCTAAVVNDYDYYLRHFRNSKSKMEAIPYIYLSIIITIVVSGIKGAIVNDYDDYLRRFLNSKSEIDAVIYITYIITTIIISGIPIILSYDVIINYCLKSVYDLPAVASLIEGVKNVIMRYFMDLSTKDVNIPQANENFPWTYYELLKFFTETVSWPEEAEGLVASSKAIVDTLSTLAVTLDTLKGEEIPLNSMLSPITCKVLNKKLTVTEHDDQFVASIKSAIKSKLQHFILSDDHLTISALLDPRFHRLITVNNFNKCLQILTEKFNRISESQGFDSSVQVGEVRPKTPLNTNVKKSNLELFFDLTETPPEQLANEQSNVEADLKRYRTEVYVSLDESPFVWWQKTGNTYGTLKHLAATYQCVPCTVNMNFKKSLDEQIRAHQKRFMLVGSLIDAIFFLHCNK
uniref:BED-type domain-containing protein n=1 Tax=Glossina morsitans morsitans TaxID=37546 RepID=A0A1B0G0H2_GLOMM